MPGSRSGWARVARVSRWERSERNTHRYCDMLRQNQGKGRALSQQQPEWREGGRRRQSQNRQRRKMQKRRASVAEQEAREEQGGPQSYSKAPVQQGRCMQRSGPGAKLPQGLKPGWHMNQAARTVVRGLNQNPPPGSRGMVKRGLVANSRPRAQSLNLNLGQVHCEETE